MKYRIMLLVIGSVLLMAGTGRAAEVSLAEAVKAAMQLPEWRISPPGEVVKGDPSEPAFDDSAWQIKKLPWDWTGGGLGADKSNPPKPYGDASSWGGWHTGLRVLWFRTSFDLPANLAGKPVVVSLGCIGDRDVTYLNGTRIGQSDSPFADRNYRVEPSVLKEKGNILAVYVRHEAPAAQYAHYHYFWGHSELGWAFPGGIWERVPSLRLASRQDAASPEAGKLTMPADLGDPADGKYAPGKELSINLISSNGRFFQNQGRDARLTLRVEKTDALGVDKTPDALRVEVLDLAGATISRQDTALSFSGKVAESPLVVALPGPGWFRIQTTPLRGGQGLAFSGEAIGGRRAVNWANLLTHKPGAMEESMFGVCHPDNVDERTFQAMNAVGARWLRWDVIWDRWNPAKGKYDFETPSVGGVIKLCKKFQIEPLPLYTYCAQWAAHPEPVKKGRRWLFSPPANPQDYYDATKAFVQHFKKDLRVFEIWNEPMVGDFLFPVEGKSPEEVYQTRVFKPAAQAIHDVDPNITVIYASQWCEPMINAKNNPQLQGLFHAAGIHPYSDDEPEIGRFGGISTFTVNSGGRSGSEWVKDPVTKSAYLTPAIGEEIRVWNTETGWFPSQYTDKAKTMKEQLNRRHIAAFVPRAYVTSVFRGVQKFFYFSLGQQMFNDSCLQANPPAVAYSTTAHFLEKTRPLAFVPLRLTVPLYLFQSETAPREFVAVIWSRGQDYWCQLPSGVKATDLQGRPAKLVDGMVLVNQEAVFLTLQADSADVARRTAASLIPYAASSSGAMDLWMNQGEASDWAKSHKEAQTGEIQP